MSIINQFLDIFLKTGAEKLEISTEIPPFVERRGIKKNISPKAPSPQQFQTVEDEFNSNFQGKEFFTYKNQKLRTEKIGNKRIFYVHNEDETSDKEEISIVENGTESSENKNIDIIKLFHLMVEKGASDLHLSSKVNPVMRIDGDMILLAEFPIIKEEALWEELKKITPEVNEKEFLETNDTDFAHEIKGLARFRANIFKDHKGIGAVFRLIPSEILSAEKLNVPQSILNLLTAPKGLILVTGPTGSGKSTTLAALIDYINENQKKHIITIEDPLEFIHPNKKSVINQREISTHTGSFKRALKAALRQDPDIILVGEMRDLETIAIAIEMAVTGHLVFGTLHTSTAIGTIDRIIDQFPSDRQSQIRTMLSDALVAVVAQNLCKRKEKGRVAVQEILVVTPAIANLIREGKNFQITTMMQTGKSVGMRLLNDSLFELVDQGIINVEEAIEKAAEKEKIKSLFRMKGLLD